MGYVCVAPRTPSHGGPETVLELLNSGVRVIPFHRHADDATLLITRLNLTYVTINSDVQAELVRPHNFAVTHEEHVMVELDDGTRLEGNIQMEMPEELNRASDFLNLSDDFFPLIARQGILLVNKSKVCVTRVFSRSPLPLAPKS